MIYTCIKTVVLFHHVLHGFGTRRGTGTTIMELKTTQEFASMDHELIFSFLYLRKAYENLYHGWLLHTLEGYRSGPRLWGLLADFWSCQEVVTHQNGFQGPQFKENRGTTHRDWSYQHSSMCQWKEWSNTG